MLNVNQQKVENFFDAIDKMALTIYEFYKKSYLDGLLLACDYIIDEHSIDEDMDLEVVLKLEEAYKEIEDVVFNNEEIRKAFQLALLKAFKHLDVHLSDITPDTIGILFAYLIDGFFKSQPSIDILDATVGTGNLLFTVMNHCKINMNKVYGVDNNNGYMTIAHKFANLTEYDVEFIIQNNLQNMLISPVDLIIADLPVDDEVELYNHALKTVSENISFKPYLMIENLMYYCKPGGVMIYLVPNNFFIKDKNDIIKEIILNDAYIQALIELPTHLFKDHTKQKSILILRKKGTNVLPMKEILMMQFPSFTEKEKVGQAIDKINLWFKNIHK